MKKLYQESFKFLKDNKVYFLLATCIFLLATIIGFALPIFFKERILEMIVELTGMLEGKNTVQIIWMIFFNNIKVSFISIALGLGLGIFPIFISVTNGYILGFVSRMVASTEGPEMLSQLIPHGIFEFPAIMLSVGAGLKLGSIMLGKSSKKDLVNIIKKSIIFFLTIIVPLLLIAAIIEGLLIGAVQ